MDMAPLFTALIDKGLPFGMLAVAIWYFRDLNDKKDILIAALQVQKDDLHTELREATERMLDKTLTAINNNTTTVNAFKEALFRNAQ